MTDLARSALVFVHLIAMSVWVGGFVTVLITKRVVDRRLDPAEAVAFFRAFGRLYGIAGGTALVVALASGGVLLADHGWDAPAVAAAVLGVGVALSTAVGVRQARAMTRLRTLAVQTPDDGVRARAVRTGARRALALRAAIGVLTLALVALGADLAA